MAKHIIQVIHGVEHSGVTCLDLKEEQPCVAEKCDKILPFQLTCIAKGIQATSCLFIHLSVPYPHIPGTRPAEVGLIVGPLFGVLAPLLIVAAVIGTFVYRKGREGKTEEERSDVNPVYGTYEVHYDPVAEVAKARIQSVK